MDSGPAKQRRRFTAAVEPIKGSIETSRAQWATAKSFHDVDCALGVLAFDGLKHPVTNQAVNYRFVTEPSWSPSDDPQTIIINLDLEVMP